MEVLDIKNPWEGFKMWLSDAQNTRLLNFNALTFSTADLQGKVTSRTVLLKDFSKEHGFIFYTNLNSCKGQALQANPFGAMLFYWDALQKQVKIEGKCSLLSATQTSKYFECRARQSQLGAWASNQSQPLKNRAELLARYRYFETKFKEEKQIPLPNYWRGIALQPTELEFWQGGEFRLHHRLRFFFDANGKWHSKILAP